ncbi:NTPase KAP [Campylobacter lari]|uniref:KAP family NTPase n=1 Tax=Campylobacter sp. CNRCH_2007_0968H TaxID=2911598 RepID=UPI00126FCED1|nr:KAP family NTPase [Campylobacter sp. CNRCH_2007_0968H]EAK0443791.1 NTPase KAP [Campylobacter lari]EAK9942382.1 NTPase KAP [Campylobacter lari]
MIQSVYKKELYFFTNNKIINYLISKEKQCLVILGSWGCGKTYFWKQIEKEITLNLNSKKVIYIDLFGKESYKQVIEEIVVSLHGNYNNITKKTFKGLEGLIKGASGGLINIDSDVIFSFLKKEDFEKIIVCLDNIERKSDNLPLKEILGLVNLLKEEKECNVVMILNKDKLKKQNDNSDNNKEGKQDTKDWYQEYKEKVVDCEYIIKDNNEIAKGLIEKAFTQNKEIKGSLVNISLKHYTDTCNNNLRLLLKILEHIKYFNKECFMLYYDKTNKKEFEIIANEYYLAIFHAVKDFYIQKNKKENVDDIYRIVTRYLNNFFIIDDNDKKTLNNIFSQQLSSELFLKFEKTYTAYFYKNSSDANFKIELEEILQNSNDKLEKITKYLSSEKFLEALYWFKKITKSNQKASEESNREYFKKIDEIIKNLIKENQYSVYDKRIRLLIAFSKRYKNYSKNIKEYNSKNKLEIFKYNAKEYPHIFHFENINKFNQYEINSIKNVFYNDQFFFNNFIDFFRLEPKNNHIKIYSNNSSYRYTDADCKGYEKIFKENNLFLAFIDYINENKIKKQMLIKKRFIINDNSNILSKLFYLQN